MNAIIQTEADLVLNIQRVARYLKRYGVPHAGVYEREGQRLLDLALAIATEAQTRLVQQSQRIQQLERLAVTDELTGLFNRRGFEEQLHVALAQARRREEGGVLVYIDLDGFKPINDNFGHAAGDEVLRHVGRTLMANLRETDAVARLGGDEFAALLPSASRDIARERALRLEKRLNGSCLVWEGVMIAPRASFGIQPYGPDDDHLSLISRADMAMYDIKRARRSETGKEAAA